MLQKIKEKKLLFILLFIQALFASFIFGMFLSSTYLEKRGMATQIASQLEGQLKSGSSRATYEVLSGAQSKYFNVIGYFDREGVNNLIFPAFKKRTYFSQRGLLDRIFNGSIEIPFFFDKHKKHLAGSLKFTYPRFAFMHLAFLAWLLILAGSIFFFRHYNGIKERNDLISKIVDQVNHDLNSPIEILFATVDNSRQTPDQKKQSIYSAIDRIKGITRDLKNYLEKDKKKKPLFKREKGCRSFEEATSIIHFYSSLKQILEDQKIAYREKNIEIQMDFDPTSLKRASDTIKESDFLRTCSNLIVNAFEAIEKRFSGKEGGKIHFALREKGKNIVLTCSDNGIGIPKEHISKVYGLGFSYDKEKGTGLGLYYVAQKIKQWGGKIHIQSKERKGTRVEMSFPFDLSLDFFESSLNLSSFEEILIVDDDRSVFHRWIRKLSGFSGKISYLSKPHIPKDKMSQIQAGKCLPLIDQEFRGDLETGLSLIIQQNLSKESFLVTNNHCQLDLLKEAQKRGIRIIPKPMIEDLAIS